MTACTCVHIYIYIFVIIGFVSVWPTALGEDGPSESEGKPDATDTMVHGPAVPDPPRVRD